MKKIQIEEVEKLKSENLKLLSAVRALLLFISEDGKVLDGYRYKDNLNEVRNLVKIKK